MSVTALAQFFTLGVGGVLGASLAVLLGDGHGLEIAGPCQATNIFGRIFGHFRHRDHRQLAPDQAALHRIVVDENQRIDPDIERRRDGSDIVRLVRPIGDETGDILGLQDHLWMVLERKKRIRFIVLGADGENDAPALQALDEIAGSPKTLRPAAFP